MFWLKENRKSQHMLDELLLHPPLIFPWGAQECLYGNEALGHRISGEGASVSFHTMPSFTSFNLEFTRAFPLIFWEEGKG